MSDDKDQCFHQAVGTGPIVVHSDVCVTPSLPGLRGELRSCRCLQKYVCFWLVMTDFEALLGLPLPGSTRAFGVAVNQYVAVPPTRTVQCVASGQS